MTENIVLVVLALAVVLSLFVSLTAVLSVAEKVSPRFRRYLEEMEQPRDRGF